VKYREINRVTGLLGTAVNVQSMVYGNLNDQSGTGVCFTRNPSNGKKELYGEYLQNAQGEDVVAGATRCESRAMQTVLAPWLTGLCA
jgi:pyruvate,orthophosphate dikinase